MRFVPFRAIDGMVNDHAYTLHQGVARRRTDESKPILLDRLTQGRSLFGVREHLAVLHSIDSVLAGRRPPQKTT
jgi:hypothetical protein